MFGYIECNRSKLSSEELERYQGVYCGLCRNLKSRYGELERLSLSYDMTFAVLFLSHSHVYATSFLLFHEFDYTINTGELQDGIIDR